MSQLENNNLRFSIDETVWLKEGQEADEILSLALEPDITIEENRSHVTIKGGLKLTGEYRPVDGYEQDDDEESPIRDHMSFRTIDEISLSEEGIATLEHTFPVDITIPTNRIDDLEDVYVMVESFDYDIPEQGCIQLFADISISGLVDQKAEITYDYEEPVDEVSYESSYPFQRNEEDDDSVSFQTIEAESYRKNDNNASEETDYPEVGVRTRSDMGVPNEIDDQQDDDDNTDTAEAPPRVNNYNEIEHQEIETNVASSIDNEEIKLDSETIDNEVETQEGRQESLEKPVIKENKQKTAHHDENALYLTKMLSNEDEQLAKVRMCIVQQGDSIEKISERYRIPVTTLIRTNKLDSDTVNDGQVLYIPAVAHKK